MKTLTLRRAPDRLKIDSSTIITTGKDGPPTTLGNLEQHVAVWRLPHGTPLAVGLDTVRHSIADKLLERGLCSGEDVRVESHLATTPLEDNTLCLSLGNISRR